MSQPIDRQALRVAIVNEKNGCQVVLRVKRDDFGSVPEIVNTELGSVVAVLGNRFEHRALAILWLRIERIQFARELLVQLFTFIKLDPK